MFKYLNFLKYLHHFTICSLTSCYSVEAIIIVISSEILKGSTIASDEKILEFHHKCINIFLTQLDIFSITENFVIFSQISNKIVMNDVGPLKIHL